MTKLSLILLVASSVVLAGAAPDSDRVSFDVVRETLPNGPRVVIHEDHTVPVVSLTLAYGVGWKAEPPGRTGVTRIIERLIAEGLQDPLPTTASARAAFVARRGLMFTGPDATYIGELFPADQLDAALERCAHVVRRLSYSRARFDHAKDDIAQFRRQHLATSPYGPTDFAVQVVGQSGDAQAWYDPAEVKAFDTIVQEDVDHLLQLYGPTNAVLAISGDIDPESTRQLLRKHFRVLPARSSAVREHAASNGRASRLTLSGAKTSAERVDVISTLSSAELRDYVHAVALATELTLDPSPLRAALVTERKLATTTFGVVDQVSSPEVVRVLALATPSTPVSQLEHALLQELEKVKTTPVSNERLNLIRRAVRMQTLETLETARVRSHRLAQMELLFGDASALGRWMDAIEKVTAADLQKMAQALWTSERTTVVVTTRQAPFSSGGQ